MAKVSFTLLRVSKELTCAPGKKQEFHWDAVQPGLGLRVTANGSRSYIFEGWLHGKSLRVTIGSVSVWLLDKARAEASRLKLLTDAGKDPRDEAAQTKADHLSAQAEKARQQVTLREAWDVYCAARRPHWSELHARDHEVLAQAGGVQKLRGKGTTTAGPLAALMPMRLADLTAKTVSNWLTTESEVRPARARLAFNLFRIFAGWAEEQAEFAGLLDPKAVSVKLMKDMPKGGTKDDCLQREQLGAFFKGVATLENPVMETYLIGLLLTGARREELATLTWGHVDFKWRSLTIRDKMDGERVIPLPPYLASLLLNLKAIRDTPPNVRQLREQYADEPWQPSEWVFSSKKSASGRIEDPNRALSRVCAVAGLPHVTLHGLRRSFSTLSEWLELPTGVVAQVMGHKPSATAERHYKVRPLDLLRMHHDRLEAWLLEQGGIEFTPADTEQKQKPQLKAV